MNYILMFSGVSHSKPHFCKIYLQQLGFKNRLLPRFTKQEINYNYFYPGTKSSISPLFELYWVPNIFVQVNTNPKINSFSRTRKWRCNNIYIDSRVIPTMVIINLLTYIITRPTAGVPLLSCRHSTLDIRFIFSYPMRFSECLKISHTLIICSTKFYSFIWIYSTSCCTRFWAIDIF